MCVCGSQRSTWSVFLNSSPLPSLGGQNFYCCCCLFFSEPRACPSGWSHLWSPCYEYSLCLFFFYQGPYSLPGICFLSDCLNSISPEFYLVLEQGSSLSFLQAAILDHSRIYCFVYLPILHVSASAWETVSFYPTLSEHPLDTQGEVNGWHFIMMLIGFLQMVSYGVWRSDRSHCSIRVRRVFLSWLRENSCNVDKYCNVSLFLVCFLLLSGTDCCYLMFWNCHI